MSLKMFSDEGCEWTHYCTVCGEAMASVIRDGQHREPERQVLDPPPEGKAPEPTVKTRTKKKSPEAEVTPDPKAPPAPKVAKAPKSAQDEGHDLLALLGWKK